MCDPETNQKNTWTKREACDHWRGIIHQTKCDVNEKQHDFTNTTWTECNEDVDHRVDWTARGSHLPLPHVGSHLPLPQLGVGANVTPAFLWGRRNSFRASKWSFPPHLKSWFVITSDGSYVRYSLLTTTSNYVLTILAPSYPNSQKNTYTMNPSYSRPVSLDPLFSQLVFLCVTCFPPVNWLVAVGRPFSSIWKLFGTVSMPCVVPEMPWSLDELKRTLISEFPILKTEEGEGFKILFDLFVEWAEILLNYHNQHRLCWIWGIVAQNPSLRGFPAAHTHVASHSGGVIAPQRTPSHSTYILTDLRTPLKASYTRKTDACSQKPFFLKKWTWRGFFVFSSEVKCSGIW